LNKQEKIGIYWCKDKGSNEATRGKDWWRLKKENNNNNNNNDDTI